MNPQVGEIWFVRAAGDWVDDEYYLITKREDIGKNIVCSMVRLSDGDRAVGYLWDDRVNWVKHF